MLDKHLLAAIRPQAQRENIVYWKNYRITVLQDRLFRLEYSANKKFRDEATQSVWFRDMPAQNFRVEEQSGSLLVITPACTLTVRENRADCRIEWNGESLTIDNADNLKGTYRTLDCCNGKKMVDLPWAALQHKEILDEVPLENGVCSKKGVAVFDDADSLTLGADGEVKPLRGDGSDEYIFVYGDDYRAAVRALYLITGNVPLIPRFALGNWWSRYYVYTDKSYLRLLNSFEEQDIPLTVATIDMDWHYSKEMERDLHITEKGRNTPFYGGNDGWTGYSWNKRLFPDYKAFLKKIQEKNLKITLNLHPADGIRWWEDCYENMANALGRDATSGEQIRFDIANPKFINAYFAQVHKPYEADGVAFWWIDWQQGMNSAIEGLDPLWSLNHYHYLDNAVNHSNGLILSRYCGIGSHRYPLGFSGDTYISWETLDYLPYFTATASNVGYTWWSHDIGGHMMGEKDDELYLRHIQYGVFSPINRLHCCEAVTCTKEPWAYGNGAGEIAKNWLRLRHSLIPYLYTASYRTHKDGIALVEPLYNQWKTPEAYAYKNEYLFGEQLLVAPVTQAAESDGFARVEMWIPEGKWTDIFTGAQYTADEKGKKVTMLRKMESIPVLIKSGGVLPLSLDKGNSIANPEKMEIRVYEGNGSYTLYEDGSVQNTSGELFTTFKTEYTEKDGVAKQALTISAMGDANVAPEKRTFAVRFKDIPDGKVTLTVDGKIVPMGELLTDCAAIDVEWKAGQQVCVEVEYTAKTEQEQLFAYALKTLICGKGGTTEKFDFWKKLSKTNSVEEYVALVDEAPEINDTLKTCLKETI